MKVRVRVPATSANLGPGFDAFGLALALYNTVVLEPARGEWQIITLGQHDVPHDETNLVAQAVRAGFETVGREPPAFRLMLDNEIPIGRGLGSSAAAIAGGLVAANLWLGQPLGRGQLLARAVELEGHPDNVAAALLGGLTIVAETSPRSWTWVRIHPPRDLRAVLFVPEQGLSTTFARSLIPDQIARADAVFNLARTALLAHAFHARAWELLKVGTQDRLHQPYREAVVPGMPELIQAAYNAGAYGAALSGAGPSILALAAERKADKVARAMRRAARAVPVAGRVLVLPLAARGALR